MIFRRLPKPDSFEQIRVCMLSKWLLDAGDKATVIAFTSRHVGEGVSTVVAGMAHSFGVADPGSVLVLDATPGRLRIGNLLKTRTRQTSLYHFETGEVDLSATVANDRKNGIDILTLGDTGAARPGIAAKARSVVERLSPYYRVILIDAGTLSKGWASHWLACSNYRVLVVDASTATREALEYDRKRFEHGGLKLDGSILNKRSYPIPKSLYWLVR